MAPKQAETLSLIRTWREASGDTTLHPQAGQSSDGKQYQTLGRWLPQTMDGGGKQQNHFRKQFSITWQSWRQTQPTRPHPPPAVSSAPQLARMCTGRQHAVAESWEQSAERKAPDMAVGRVSLHLDGAQDQARLICGDRCRNNGGPRVGTDAKGTGEDFLGWCKRFLFGLESLLHEHVHLSRLRELCNYYLCTSLCVNSASEKERGGHMWANSSSKGEQFVSHTLPAAICA